MNIEHFIHPENFSLAASKNHKFEYMPVFDTNIAGKQAIYFKCKNCNIIAYGFERKDFNIFYVITDNIHVPKGFANLVSLGFQDSFYKENDISKFLSCEENIIKQIIE